MHRAHVIFRAFVAWVFLCLYKLTNYFYRQWRKLKTMTTLDVLGIPEGMALNPNSAVFDKNGNYVLLNLTYSTLALPAWGNEKEKFVDEFGKRGCYKYLMGEEASSGIIRDLWHRGLIAIFDAEDFPEADVIQHTVMTNEGNPYTPSDFDRSDFTAATENGNEILTMSSHVVNPKKTDKFIKDHFNSGYFKRFEKEYKLPPQAAHFNAEAFDENGYFDQNEWLKDARRGKEETL